MLPVLNLGLCALSGSDLLSCGTSTCVRHQQMDDLLQPALPTGVEFAGRCYDCLQLV
jgi:hypothetical protein